MLTLSLSEKSELTELLSRVGDFTNLETYANADSIFWRTIDQRGGLTLQVDWSGKNARIIDSSNTQKANGSLNTMREKMKRLLAEDFLKAGDVIGVSRGVYEHYGIYAGDGKVVHYAGNGSDFNGEISIREAPFNCFIKDSREYFVLSFEEKYPVRIHSSTKFISSGDNDLSSIDRRKVYSSQETLQRAYSRIGESRYSLISNNCEHFALWCKTGKAVSTQVIKFARYVLAAGTSSISMAESKKDIINYLKM